MTIHRFLIENAKIDLAGGTVEIVDAQQIKQITRVLRLGLEDRIDVVDHSGKVYQLRLASLSPGTITGEIVSVTEPRAAKPFKIIVVLALLKGGNFESSLTKLTEIGVDVIMPVITERTVVKVEMSEKQSSYSGRLDGRVDGNADVTVDGNAHATADGDAHATADGDAHATADGNAHATADRDAHATADGDAGGAADGNAHATAAGRVDAKADRKLDRKLDGKAGGKADGKMRRWMSIVKEAVEQCERARSPQVVAIQSLKKALNDLTNTDNPPTIFICAERSQAPHLVTIVYSRYFREASPAVSLSDICIVIGPEGGFTEQEIDQAISLGCLPCRLGDNILRSETAATVAAALVASLGEFLCDNQK